MNAVTPLLNVRGVTKTYGSLTAVDTLSLQIHPGEIFALLGPNGAGKTTLISCITGLIQKFSGRIEVAGFDVRQQYRLTRQLVGVVPQELNFDGFSNARQTLIYQGGMFGFKDAARRADELLNIFGLKEKAKANTRSLSGGMKRRLMVCKALMHRPSLLFLDEPTAGVDVELREELWNYVRKLREHGTTIVLTTHYLQEAEELADRIGILNQGRLILVEERERLLQRYGKHWIRYEFSNPVPDSLLRKLKDYAPECPGSHQVVFHYFEPEPGESGPQAPIPVILQTIQEHDLEIRGIQSGGSSLESIFRQILHADNQNGNQEKQ